jgi:hypothetical protein
MPTRLVAFPFAWMIPFACCAGLALPAGTRAQPEPMKPPADKPPYQRLLPGDDAKQAAELAKQVTEREAAGDFAGEVQAAKELLALRERVQGADHWETVNARWRLHTAERCCRPSPRTGRCRPLSPFWD